MLGTLAVEPAQKIFMEASGFVLKSCLQSLDHGSDSVLDEGYLQNEK